MPYRFDRIGRMNSAKAATRSGLGYSIIKRVGRCPVSLRVAIGMQISSVQILNAILNIKDPGHIGQATKNTRKYMIQPQRRRLDDIDMIGKKLRQLIVKSNNIKVILLYNKILQVLTNWRVSHQTRGYRYLSYDDERTSYQMASGLTIETTTQSVEDIFWQHMQDRIVETENTKIKS
mgnify:FL=1